MIEISVLMPVYNAEKYIGEAVESILNQTFSNFEFIIINDGSTDKSLTILEEYAKQDQRIRLISRENKGLVATLNEGIHLSKAPLIARMDADDISMRARLEIQHEYLSKHLNTVCVGSYFGIIDEEGDLLTSLIGPTSNEDIQADLIRGRTVICHPTALMRKRAVVQAGLYRQEHFMVEDLDLWLRLGENGTLANIPEVLLYYRQLNSSISGNADGRQEAAASHVIKITGERRGTKTTFEGNWDWRPKNTADSKFSFLLKYGWWAFNSYNKKAAIKYALRAIKTFPFKRDGWVLLISTILKKPKNNNENE